MELEKEYVFPYAGKKDNGEYISGIVDESQIVSILGELPNGKNYDELIGKAEEKNLENWVKTLNFWKDNDIF